MKKIELLFNDQYFLLKHIYFRSELIEGEYILPDSIDQLTNDTKIPKRTLCRLLKVLEMNKFIQKSKQYPRRYCISNSTRTMIEKLLVTVNDSK